MVELVDWNLMESERWCCQDWFTSSTLRTWCVTHQASGNLFI